MGVRVPFSSLYADDTEFDMASGDLTQLEIRLAKDKLFYFYDREHRRLVTDFVLEEKPRVALLCQVTLVESAAGYSPRIRLWRKDKSKSAGRRKVAVEADVPVEPHTRRIKALVSTEGGHDHFWTLVSYLQGLTEIDIAATRLRVLDDEQADVVAMFADRDREGLLAAVSAALGGRLTEQDIGVLAGRKGQVERFRRLLQEPDYLAAEEVRLNLRGEALWQQFFEEATWIFGYGLHLVAFEALREGRLEQITTGASVFQGGGKRSDAVLRSRALLSTLLFCEIKRPDTLLLEPRPYRSPDVYAPSGELVGGTAQLQKTVRKAIRALAHQVEQLTAPDGSPTGVEFSTTRPRQVLLIGNLDEFAVGHGMNGEQVEAFELYRRSMLDVEVITFDELYERAKFITNP